MSRTITIIAAFGAALTLGVPAWGAIPVEGLDARHPATEAVVIRGEELGRVYQGNPQLFGHDPASVAILLRSEALGRAYRTNPNLFRGTDEVTPYGYSAIAVRKAIEEVQQQQTSMLNAREQAFAAKRNAQLASGTFPDVVERAVRGRGTGSDDHFMANDNRFRVTPVDDPVTVSATGSGNEIEWPQIGIGLGIGIALMLGLGLALKATRQPPLAH